MTEILNIYKTEDWTAEIITTDDGIVQSVEISINPAALARMERLERQAWLAYKRRGYGRRANPEDDALMLSWLEGQ